MTVLALVICLSALFSITTATAGYENFISPLPMETARRFSTIHEELGSHKMIKRQAVSDTEEFCCRVQTEELCSNGFYQDWINIIFECNEPEALDLHKGCQIDSEGEYCLFKQGRYNQTLCKTGSSNCTQECKEHLVDIQNNIDDCCIDILGIPADMWSKCGLERATIRATIECPSTTELPETHSNSCGSNNYQQTSLLYSTVFCNQGYLEATDTAISATEGCEDYAFYNNTLPLCFANKTGHYCFIEVDQIEQKVKNASEKCLLSNDTCEPSCKNALTDLLSHGCCLNVHNTSEDDIWSSYKLWKQCGLETPGFCKHLLTDLPIIMSSSDTSLADITEMEFSSGTSLPGITEKESSSDAGDTPTPNFDDVFASANTGNAGISTILAAAVLAIWQHYTPFETMIL